jgi:hypothetical protein
MPVLSGKDGTLRLGGAEVLQLTFWQIEKTAANRAYAANDTGGAKRRVSGAKDCTGRLEVKATDAAKVPVAEGDVVALALHADASGDNYYELSAIVDSIRVEVDISEGKPVAYGIRFSADGPITAHGILRKDEG